MKQVFCDIDKRPEEKSVEIRVRSMDGDGVGLRRHFCTEQHRVVAVDSGGIHEDAPLFCPLCGGLMSLEAPQVRGHFDEKFSADGIDRCEHGFPNAPCGELIARGLHDYELRFRWGIPEYRAARLAAEFEPAQALWRWARPCATCRREYLRGHLGLIEHELRRLCEHLSKKSRSVRSLLEAVQSDVNLAHALLDDLRLLKSDIERAFAGASMGYVYAITDGRAIKIRWLARHPGLTGGRLSQLQTAHPDELRLIGTFLATQQHESELHGKFSAHHIRGEWFRYVPEIVEHFDSQ